jgi:hypothetical protein
MPSLTDQAAQILTERLSGELRTLRLQQVAVSQAYDQALGGLADALERTMGHLAEAQRVTARMASTTERITALVAQLAQQTTRGGCHAAASPAPDAVGRD